MAVSLPGQTAEEAKSGEAAGKDLLSRFSPEEREKLLKGEAIYRSVLVENPDGSSSGHGEAIAIVKAPTDECFAMFCEFEKWKLYFPRMMISKVLERSGDKAIFYKELDFKLVTIRYTQTLTIDPKAHCVDFTVYPEGVNDIKASDGYFLFEKIDDQNTLLSYGLTKMDIGVTIPKFIQDYMSSKDLPGIVINIKKRIESGGKWEK